MTVAVLADPVTLVAGLLLFASVVCGAVYLRSLWRAAEWLPRARGRDLDNLASVYGHQRKRWLWIFRERDKTFRDRVTNAVRDWPKGRL
jgi:hypothetical protein